ncbi:unnamed protein product [Symbiodinium natans]|uniref:Right handed beta helix domain-containing protein n=1 Tax=Symbiodinium natans TaxID=878477 RepID=A0A812PAL7_9DINO|nr:unnamed protein product [Symbiodinium natans]
MALATWAVALLRLVLASRALRPQQHLWQLESAPAIAPPARKAAKASKLEVKADVQPRGLMKSWLSHEQAGLPPCDELPGDGNRTLDSALNLSACTWRASGAQVLLGAPLTFQGDLVLQGELQITGAKELDRPCITVLGNLTLVDARVSFLNCKEQVQVSNLGGALFVQEDLSAFNSSIAFKNCRGTSGGGLHAKSFLLEQSKADFDNCTASSMNGGGGGAYIKETFRMNANSSASFRGCSAELGRGGGLHAESFLLEQSKADFDNCTASEVMGGGGGAYIKETFRMNFNSSASFRGCSAELGGGLHAKSFLLEQSKADFDNSMASGLYTGGGGGAHIVETFRMNINSSASFRGCSAENGVLVARSSRGKVW